MWYLISQAMAGDSWSGTIGAYDPATDITLSLVAVGGGLAVEFLPPASREGVSSATTVRWSEEADRSSDDLLLGGAVIGAAGAIVVGGLLQEDKCGYGHLAGLANASEAIGGAWLATGLGKVLVSRPRPWTSEAYGEYDAERQRLLFEEKERSGGAWTSMPSGHTSIVAAAGFSAATTWLVGEVSLARHGEGNGVRLVFASVAELAALGATIYVGDLRVKAGAHHTSDTVVGGILGATFGVGVPVLHAVARDRNWSPSVGSNGTLGVVGRW